MPLSFNPFDMVDVFQGAIAAIGLVAAIIIALGLISLRRAKGGRAGRGGDAQ